MKYVLLFLLFIGPISITNSQTINRVEVRGTIISTSNEVEAVTVFNQSSNTGTITNEKGAFTIKVALNDVIEISALQFQAVTITINNEAIKSKQLKIQLIEQVNQLNAVTLSSGLSGNLQIDIQNVKIVKLKPIDLGNMNAFDMSEDKAFDKGVIQNHLQAIINPDARNYLPDLVKILDMFKSKNKSRKSKNNNFNQVTNVQKPYNLLDLYPHKKLSETLNMPQERVEAFVAFVENNGITPELLNPESEMQLIAFLIKQKETFLKLQDAKN